ncbi:MAG: hypothetical protein HYZ23_05260 [Chloroflexi bacterium]|nr:hypothetical protein [Chloroflexota bacterium]
MPSSSSSAIRLLKCPACGGPLDPPAGESSMKCTYCGSGVVIPESLRAPKQGANNQHVDIFSGINMNAMVGYGAQWAEVVQLAQSGNKAEAVKKYMALTGNDEASATNTVNNLAGSQSYEFAPGNVQSVQQLYAPIMAQTAETIKTTTRMSMWIGCGIAAFVMLIILITVIPIIISVFASLTPLLR